MRRIIVDNAFFCLSMSQYTLEIFTIKV